MSDMVGAFWGDGDWSGWREPSWPFTTLQGVEFALVLLPLLQFILCMAVHRLTLQNIA